VRAPPRGERDYFLAPGSKLIDRHVLQLEYPTEPRFEKAKITNMKFATLIEYTPDKAKIAATRPEHRDYLKNVLESGRLVISGPFAGDEGGLLVYEANSREDVEAILRDDPFTKAGVFVSWKIHEWRVVMVNPKLCTAG
jgi:uncharacterized protein